MSEFFLAEITGIHYGTIPHLVSLTYLGSLQILQLRLTLNSRFSCLHLPIAESHSSTSMSNFHGAEDATENFLQLLGQHSAY